MSLVVQESSSWRQQEPSEAVNIQVGEVNLNQGKKEPDI